MWISGERSCKVIFLEQDEKSLLSFKQRRGMIYYDFFLAAPLMIDGNERRQRNETRKESTAIATLWRMVVVWTSVNSCGIKENTAGAEIERWTLKVEASGKIRVWVGMRKKEESTTITQILFLTHRLGGRGGGEEKGDGFTINWKLEGLWEKRD